jgi:hypothetical protein
VDYPGFRLSGKIYFPANPDNRESTVFCCCHKRIAFPGLHILFKLYILHYSKFHVIRITKSGNFPYCCKPEHFEFPYGAVSAHVHDSRFDCPSIRWCVADTEMNKYEEEMNAIYSKTLSSSL